METNKWTTNEILFFDQVCTNCVYLHVVVISCMTERATWSHHCRWGPPEWAVVAFLPGGGGRLFFWPLHLHLPHAGLPVLQEGRHWLQGELSAPPFWEWWEEQRSKLRQFKSFLPLFIYLKSKKNIYGDRLVDIALQLRSSNSVQFN